LDYLTYRCGGSAGLNPVAFYRLPVSPLGRTGQRTPERALSLPPNHFSVKFGDIHPHGARGMDGFDSTIAWQRASL
jgi:hypothetical protein